MCRRVTGVVTLRARECSRERLRLEMAELEVVAHHCSLMREE